MSESPHATAIAAEVSPVKAPSCRPVPHSGRRRCVRTSSRFHGSHQVDIRAGQSRSHAAVAAPNEGTQMKERAGLFLRFVHLPVGGDELFFSHEWALSIRNGKCFLNPAIVSGSPVLLSMWPTSKRTNRTLSTVSPRRELRPWRKSRPPLPLTGYPKAPVEMRGRIEIEGRAHRQPDRFAMTTAQAFPHRDFRTIDRSHT